MRLQFYATAMSSEHAKELQLACKNILWTCQTSVPTAWWCELQYSCTQYHICTIGHERQFASVSKTSACHGYFPALPVTLYQNYIYTSKALEKRFSMLAECSYSSESIRRKHRFGPLAFDKILGILLLCADYTYCDTVLDFQENINISPDFPCS